MRQGKRVKGSWHTIDVVVAVVCTALVAAAAGDCFPTLAGILQHPSCVHKLWR